MLRSGSSPQWASFSCHGFARSQPETRTPRISWSPWQSLIQLPRYRGFHTVDSDGALKLDLQSGPAQPYSKKRRHAVFGWPESRAQCRIDRPRRHIRQRSFSFCTGEAAPGIVSEAGFDSSTHLVLDFDPAAITVRGQPHGPPDPTGLSGSAALYVDDNNKLWLAGIMIQKKNPARDDCNTHVRSDRVRSARCRT